MAEFTQSRPKCMFTYMCDYDEDTEVLVVEFTGFRKDLAAPPLDGRPYVYFYEGVPAAVGNFFMDNDCDGTYYNFFIRGQPGPEYAYTRVS